MHLLRDILLIALPMTAMSFSTPGCLPGVQRMSLRSSSTARCAAMHTTTRMQDSSSMQTNRRDAVRLLGLLPLAIGGLTAATMDPKPAAAKLQPQEELRHTYTCTQTRTPTLIQASYAQTCGAGHTHTQACIMKAHKHVHQHAYRLRMHKLVVLDTRIHNCTT
jgi:hypothetical protein